jgi:hypothetical protein
VCVVALHNLTPTGGFGINTGILDAVDLAWKLEGVRAGWAPPAIFQTYKAERQPVAVRNVTEATFTFAKFLSMPNLPALCDPTPEGAAARERMGRHISENEFEREFRNEGIVLGYRYEGSPICIPDGTPEPEDTAMTYTPTTRPGARAPHVPLDDGRSTLDLYGRSFILLASGPGAPPAGPLLAAAAARGVPLQLEHRPEPAVAARYERPLVLVRPDGHVAWRGDAVPPDPLALIDTVRGATAPKSLVDR